MSGPKIENISDRLDLVRPDRENLSWVEGDDAFPDEVELQLWKKVENAEMTGHSYVAKARYRRVEDA